jgi:predicted O-linked N-acetylglucosamine transferase (SPINDLY family)
MQGPVSPLPASTRGFVTFGSLNSYTKVGPRVVELWAEVLHAVPNSRIKLITVPEGEAQAELWARFAALGIPRERVELHGRLGREAYLAVFDDVDIALDPFPCNGGTTTCDSLWMGLPVVALRGGSFLSRAALSVLTAAGCAEWAADDAAAYVENCRSLAADLPALAATRAGLRPRIAASPVTDAPAFARDVEAAYRAMWRQWCAGGEA